VIAFGALTGPVPKAGVVAVAVAAALTLLLADRRLRAWAMGAALVLAPVLLVADLWSSPQVRILHRHPLVAVVAGLIAVAVGIALAVPVARRPAVIAPLAVFALPFRVPIQSGGKTSNLLVPLYVVVGLGALAWIGSVARAQRRERGAVRRERQRLQDIGRHRNRDPTADGGGIEERGSRVPGLAAADGLAGWTERLLAIVIVLYAVQSIYSRDFVSALQNVVFFYVPFTLLYRLLRDLEWSPRMVRGCLALTAALAVVFSGIAFVEYATKTIILNSKLVLANDLHTYFTVNSVFYDPDIFGRYLALVMILVAVGLLYARPSREQLAAVAVLAVLWAGLVLTLSRSSLGALLVGLAVLAALRWKPSRALVVAVVVVGIGAAAVALSPGTFGLNQGVQGATSGRGGLVSGGLSLFGDRPIQGWGSGSFVTEYRAHHRNVATTLSASHTIPVTIAAEQGLIGEITYIALVVCAIVCLVRGARGDPVRSAVAAAFVALIFHTMLYADFLEDPTTWALLAIGLALGGVPRRRTAPGATAQSTSTIAPRGAPAV
jgi:O-antigen ligase